MPSQTRLLILGFDFSVLERCSLLSAAGPACPAAWRLASWWGRPALQPSRCPSVLPLGMQRAPLPPTQPLFSTAILLPECFSGISSGSPMSPISLMGKTEAGVLTFPKSWASLDRRSQTCVQGSCPTARLIQALGAPPSMPRPWDGAQMGEADPAQKARSWGSQAPLSFPPLPSPVTTGMRSLSNTDFF